MISCLVFMTCSFDVLLPAVQDWGLPVHRKKPLQDVLGCMRDILVCFRRYSLFLMAQVEEHKAGE
jgi:hypothetical protein